MLRIVYKRLNIVLIICHIAVMLCYQQQTRRGRAPCCSQNAPTITPARAIPNLQGAQFHPPLKGPCPTSCLTFQAKGIDEGKGTVLLRNSSNGEMNGLRGWSVGQPGIRG